jgi:hypothetical protein
MIININLLEMIIIIIIKQEVKVKLFLYIINLTAHHEGVWRSGGIA